MVEREKGRIIQVGTVGEDGQPHGWAFDGQGRGIGLEIDTATGEVWRSGWSVDELRKVAEEETGA